MKILKKGFLSRFVLIFAGLSLFEYALFHVQYLLSAETVSVLISYIRYYYSLAWDFLMPAISALIMLIVYSGIGKRDAILGGAYLALTRLAFFILYYYMFYISQGFDSIESVSLSLLTSIAFSLLSYLEILLCFGVGMLVMSRAAKKRGVNTEEYMLPAMMREDILDVGIDSTRMTAFMSLTVFIVRLVPLIINTVSFLIENGTHYTGTDIREILIDYLMLLILLILTHIILSKSKKAIIKSRAYTED